MIKQKDAGRYERITGGAGKQRQIRGRYRPRRAHLLVVHPDKKLRCSVKIDVPRTLKSYELVDIDERTDIISFPVQ